MHLCPEFHFTKPIGREGMKKNVEKSVPLKTRQQTEWNFRLWIQWCLHHIRIAEHEDHTLAEYTPQSSFTNCTININYNTTSMLTHNHVIV